MELFTENFVAEITTGLTTMISANIEVIAGLVVLGVALGFVLRAFRKSKNKVESRGGKIA